jgi:hypothetical protein
MNKSNLLLALAAAALLAACGGGSGDAVVETPVAGVPDSANASIAGMAAWISSETATSPDTAEPLDVTAFSPPVADNIEPLGLAI